MVANYGQSNKETFGKIQVWKSLNLESNILQQIWTFYKTFKKVGAYIYIQRSLSKFSGAIAFICKLSGKKFVYMVANDGEVDLTHPFYKKTIWKFLAGRLFILSSMICVQSEYQKNQLKKNFNRDSVIIRSVINPPGQTTIINEKNYILWIGRCDKVYKQPEIFLRLAERLPNYKFVMISPPATEQQEFFISIKKQAESVPNVKFIDFVPYHETSVYFNKAKLLVNTSSQEGFPATFLQAGIHRTPILSLNINPDGIFSKYGIGLVCHNDFDELIKNFNTIIDENLYKKQSENIYLYTIKNHDIEKNTNEFYKYIKSLS